MGAGALVTPDLERLWSLRALDDEIATIRTSLARFEVERKTLDVRITAARARLEQLQHRLADIQLKRREIEREIDAAGAEERKFQSQLPAVKKNEEYQALLHEIAAAKARRSDLETRVLLRMEDEDAAQRERPELDLGLRAAEQEAKERRARIDGDEAAERARLEGLETSRRARVAELEPLVRSRYERIHASLDGRAVVPILKNACGGCFRGQPPQNLQEARRGDRVMVCEGCGRLLVWPPDTT